MQPRQQFPTLLPDMSTDEFIRLARETEKRVLAEPEEKRKKRALYLSKVNYDNPDRKTLDFINNVAFTTTFFGLLKDENYVPHPALADFLNACFALIIINATGLTIIDEYHAKLSLQYNTRVGIAKSATELFNQLYNILFTGLDQAKQKEEILKLERKLLDLKNAYVKAGKEGLLAAPAISKDTIQNAITNSIDALHLYASKITGAGDAFHTDLDGPGVVDTSYLSNPLEKEKKDALRMQRWQNEANETHDQLESLINVMQDYPSTICKWFVEVFLAAKKNINFESACIKVKSQIEAELQKDDILKFKDVANLNYIHIIPRDRIEDNEQPGSAISDVAKPKPQTAKAQQSQAATLSALVAHTPASRSRPAVELSIVPVPGVIEEKQQTPPSPSTPPSKSSQKSSGTPPLGPTSVTRQSDSATPVKLTATHSTLSYAGDKGKKPAQAADVEKSQSCCVVL